MAGVKVVVLDMVVGHSGGLLPLGVTLSLHYLSCIFSAPLFGLIKEPAPWMWHFEHYTRRLADCRVVGPVPVLPRYVTLQLSELVTSLTARAGGAGTNPFMH